MRHNGGELIAEHLVQLDVSFTLFCEEAEVANEAPYAGMDLRRSAGARDDAEIRPPATGTWSLPPIPHKEPVFGGPWSR
jgi:hypothetical protein